MKQKLLKEEGRRFLEATGECKEALDIFVNTRHPYSFEKFSQALDKIHALARVLDLKELDELSFLGKELSYKASVVNDMNKLLALQSLLSQLLKSIEKQYYSPVSTAELIPLISKLKSASKSFR